MTLKSHAKFEEKLTCGLENDMRNLANFYQNTWKCQNWYFHGILLFKVENAWGTNYMSYREFISNGTEELWNLWKEIDLSFQNWHKEFDEFWRQNSKVSKIYTFMVCFWPNYILFELKNVLCLIALKIGTNFERKLACVSKNWHEEFGKFSPEPLKVSKLGPWWYTFV